MASADIKATITNILHDAHKELIKNETLEFNELNIITEFHSQNLEFAQSMQLTKDKIALLLNAFASMLQFGESNCPIIETYEQFQSYKETVMATKYLLLKNLLSPYTKENAPVSMKVFTADEIEQILKYFTASFLDHSHLFEMVFSKRQTTQLKRLEVYIDEPSIPEPLSNAMFIGSILEDNKQDNDV